MNSNTIRQKFLSFFEEKQHEIVSGAPIVLKDDPTLMFTNSGMNQFKDYFLGYTEPKFKRAADTQKCLRVSGKHNDLDDVGKDTYHHTMFEMLGNWSFGDYFKKEAIAWAWELLTEVFKISKENLYVTIFEGNEEENLPEDTEAATFWKEHIAENRILKGDKKDNFWEMGASGPCGPCSEIHVDLRSEEEKKKKSGAELVNKDHPQVVEIWNLVFMQFNRKADGSLENLPHYHIDTGMGFERLCMVLQNKTSNYDTDVFSSLIQKVEELTQHQYNKNTTTDVAIRVVVDHLRAVSFAIADGQLPSNTGAGYVIRRILRRAISYAYRFLNQKDTFIYRLVDGFVHQYGEAFPELKRNQDLITKVIEQEEESFLKTIHQGLNLLNDLIEKTEGRVLEGKAVFELYDTYGFPLDLSQLIAAEKGFSIDEKAYEAEMEKQKQRSKAAATSSKGDWEILLEGAEENFIGYDACQANVEISRYRVVEDKKGQFYQLVFNQTPFYAEGGGQVGDKGYLLTEEGDKIEILDTKKENNLIYHLAQKLPQNFKNLKAVVNESRRKNIMRNHTATHLLHQALRAILGTHVEQKGSYVSGDYLRFDFSHFEKLTEEQLNLIQQFVNNRIKEEIPLEENREISLTEALEKGAMALFGEKYGDKVRMIQFGDSKELCGGTHAGNTADLFTFKIIAETSSAAGIRRIEAVTGQGALEFYQSYQSKYEQIEELMGNPAHLNAAIEKLIAENQKNQEKIKGLEKIAVGLEKEKWLKEEKNIKGISSILVQTEMDNSGIKDLIFNLKSENPERFILVMNTQNDKPTLSVGVGNDLVEKRGLNAGQLVREWAKIIKGGGGGQPDFASAGGKEVAQLPEVLKTAQEFLENL